MKKNYIYIAILTFSAVFAQEDEQLSATLLPNQLSLAVRQSQGWNINNISTPDFSFYNRNYRSVFSNYNYTFNILDEKLNRVYIEGDKYYSNTYIPIVAQQLNSSLAIDNMYMYRTNSAPSVGVNVNALKR